MRNILNIEINNSYIKTVVLRKDSKKIYIDKEQLLNIETKELKVKINEEHIANIKELLLTHKINKKYDYILYNIQTEDVVVRTIKNINIKSKKEADNIIKYEIIKYIPINRNEYEIKYKILNKKENIATVQVTLFPKYLINLCKDISKSLHIKIKSINVNFDNIQKLIQQNIITNLNENAAIIELRRNEILLNKVVENQILESYIIPQNLNIIKHINSLDEKIKNIYVYGTQTHINENLFKYSDLYINKIILNMKEKAVVVSPQLDQEIHKYINTIATVV